MEDYRKIDEIPFNFERRRVKVVLEHGAQRLLIVKGAPESIFSRFVSNSRARVPCTRSTRAAALNARPHIAFSARAVFECWAVAYTSISEKEVYETSDETALTLSGFLTFSDPPLETAPLALRALHRDGVQVKILTEDSEVVAQQVCTQVGLNVSRVVLGDELERTCETQRLLT